MSDEPTPLYRFLAPRYWLTWLALGAIRAVVALPHRWRLTVGRLIGRLGLRLGSTRRRIAARNLELCFPELDAAARGALLRRHFESLGMAIIETGICWWMRDARLRPLLQVVGKEHLDAALARGHGAIMLTGHFNPVDLGGRFLTMVAPVTAMYRPLKNALLDEMMRRGREASARGTVRKRDVRGMIRALRNNHAIWYAPDQTHRRKHSVVVPFFSIPAPTNSSTSRVARVSKAAVVPFFPERRADGRGYRLVVRPALDNFPSGDEQADTARIIKLLEDRAREFPADYLWIHRRFKKAAPDGIDYYADLPA